MYGGAGPTRDFSTRPASICVFSFCWKTHLNREDISVEVNRQFAKNPNVPVFEKRCVIRRRGADVQRVRRVGCPARADEVGLVEHVLIPVIPTSYYAIQGHKKCFL